MIVFNNLEQFSHHYYYYYYYNIIAKKEVMNEWKDDELNAIAIIIMTYTLERIDHYDGYGFMMPHAFAYKFIANINWFYNI